MLYTTKEIAEMYGQNVTPYMITHTWVKNGLRHIKGKGSGFLFKREWVEEYLESMTQEKQEKQNKIKIHKGKKIQSNSCYVQ